MSMPMLLLALSIAIPRAHARASTRANGIAVIDGREGNSSRTQEALSAASFMHADLGTSSERKSAQLATTARCETQLLETEAARAFDTLSTPLEEIAKIQETIDGKKSALLTLEATNASYAMVQAEIKALEDKVDKLRGKAPGKEPADDDGTLPDKEPADDDDDDDGNPTYLVGNVGEITCPMHYAVMTDKMECGQAVEVLDHQSRLDLITLTQKEREHKEAFEESDRNHPPGCQVVKKKDGWTLGKFNTHWRASPDPQRAVVCKREQASAFTRVPSFILSVALVAIIL